MTDTSLRVGSENWAVKETKLLGYNLLQNKFVPVELDVSRATTGTITNSSGYIEQYPYNLLRYSEDYTQIWVKSNSTVTANIIANPIDGLLTGSLISLITGSGYILQTLSVVKGRTYIFSFYLKNFDYVGGEYLNVNFSDGVIGGYTARYTFSTDTLTTIAGVWSNVSATKEALANGWFKISCTGTCNNTGSGWLEFYSTGNIRSFYLFGVQIAESSTNKPYFPTTTRLNVPRIDYSGGISGLLIEPQRTNSLIYSESMGVNWPLFSNNGGSAPTSGRSTYIVDPMGSYNTQIVTGATSSIGSWGTYQFITAGLPATTYIASIYAKAGTATAFSISYANFSGSGQGNSYFNLSNGTTPTPGASIESVGNGWYRCIASPFTTSTASVAFWNIGVYVSPNTSTTIWSSDYTGKNIYFFGAQFEAGSYATSYIPTATSVATRNLDSITLAGASSLIGQSEGSFFLDLTINAWDTNSFYFGVYGGGNEIYLRAGVGAIQFVHYFGGVQASIVKTGLLLGRHQVSIGYKNNDWVMYVDGSLVGSDTSGTFTGTMSGIGFGYQPVMTVYPPYLKVHHALLYKTRLTNPELLALATPPIVTSALKLNLDASQTSSYPGTGSIWYDISGYGNNSELVGGPSYNAGSDISFSTASMYLACLAPGGILRNNNFVWDTSGVLGATSISIEVWFKSGQTSFPGTYLLAKPWNGGGQYNYSIKLLSTSSFQLACHLSSGAFTTTTISGVPLVDSTWKQFTFWINNTQIGYYINGGQYSGSFTHSISGSFPSSNENLAIAIMTLYPYFSAANPSFSITGNLASVKFYSRKLSSTEVLQNYNSQKSRFGLS